MDNSCVTLCVAGTLVFLPPRRLRYEEKTMASLLAGAMRAIAQRSSNNIAKSATAEAWETTSSLRTQYIVTSMNAMPARVAEAASEWSAVRQKIAAREITLNDLAIGTARAVELYAFYFVGKVIGSRSVPI